MGIVGIGQMVGRNRARNLGAGPHRMETRNDARACKVVHQEGDVLRCLVGQELESDDFVGSCAAGLSTLTVMPNGDVMPCRRMNVVIGNLREKSLFDIWYSSEMLWKLREREKNLKICGKCKNLNVCGGCRAVAFGVTGDYFAKDPQCWKK